MINNTSIVPSAGKPCQVLALLAINGGRTVSQSALSEELWGEDPPVSATTLHTYIHQIRSHIGRAIRDHSRLAAKDILVTERNGYSLHLGSGDTDVQEFRRLSQAGSIAFEYGDFREASRIFERALALWRAPAFSDIQTGPLLSLETLSLEDARIAALNRRIEVDLRLGRHLELMAELRTLTLQDPLNESFSAHYMVSLYYSGLITRALDEYRRIRTVLIDELGVEPSSRLRRLQNAILTGDPVLEDPPLMSGLSGTGSQKAR